MRVFRVKGGPSGPSPVNVLSPLCKRLTAGNMIDDIDKTPVEPKLLYAKEWNISK
jgi:hypothetical protein